MDARRRKLLVNLLQGGAFLGVAGVLPSHADGMRDASQRDMSLEGAASSYDAPPIQVDSIAAMRRLETSRLADGQRVEVTGYYLTTQGLGGGSFQWAAHSRQPEDGGLSIAAAGASEQAEGRFVRRVGSTLTPAMFGAMGDGSDQYAPLMRLAKAASTMGLAVTFPPGDYALSDTGVIFSGIAISGAGPARTTLRYTGHERGSLVVIRDGATIEGMTLDGNVSADPDTWTPRNYDAFTGCLPLDLRGRDVVARNVVCRRSPMACLRVEARGFKLENVRTHHARGNFGDGIFVVDSRDGSVERCEARDFTRIGFVSDTYGRSPIYMLSERIDFIDCLAENGHHGSYDYGGAELNAGYWAENSHAVRFIDCRSRETTHHGFVAATGRAPSQGTGHFSLQGCIAETTNIGFFLKDLHGIPVHHTITHCHAGEVEKGFCMELDLDASRLDGRHLTTRLRGEKASGSSYVLEGTGIIELAQIEESWQTFNATRQAHLGAPYASIVSARGFTGQLHLRHFTRQDATPISIKLLGQSHLLAFSLAESHAELSHVPAESVELHDCHIEAGWIKAFDALEVAQCRLGDGTPRFDLFETTRRHRYHQCRFDFTPGGGQLYLHNVDKQNARRLVRFEGCHFRKDLALHGSMITLDAAPAVFHVAESNTLTFSDCRFDNTGARTDTPVVHTDQRPPQASLTGQDNRKNATIDALAAFAPANDFMAES
ncbi:hypothetical protein J8402_06695 [Chromohalobacter israelensis]|uniref:hypothetical protein n=1 Tax=Chromohalobacter israelensis TaxID=141390 RepID=UPI003AF4E46A